MPLTYLKYLRCLIKSVALVTIYSEADLNILCYAEYCIYHMTGGDKLTCNKIDKALVVYRFSNVT